MKTGLEQANGDESFRIAAIKTVNEIFKKAYLQSAVFEKSSADAFLIKPFADLTGEVPLTDHHQHAQNYQHSHDADDNVDGRDPGVVQMKASNKGQGPQDKKDARHKAVKKVLGCDRGKPDHQRQPASHGNSFRGPADKDSERDHRAQRLTDDHCGDRVAER